jgi:hypothetical protein
MKSVRKIFWEMLTVPLRLREVSDSRLSGLKLYVSWCHSDLPLLLFNQSLPIRMSFDNTLPTLSQGLSRKQETQQTSGDLSADYGCKFPLTHYVDTPRPTQTKAKFGQFHPSLCRAYKWQLRSSFSESLWWRSVYRTTFTWTPANSVFWNFVV